MCGQPLPPGLEESSPLPEPIFTPSTKAEGGDHDENIAFDHVVALLGRDLATRVRDLSLALYGRARAVAEPGGIIVADTKFEFGFDVETSELMLIDEALTPDSSRFWPKETYQPGRPQPSFDKQFRPGLPGVPRLGQTPARPAASAGGGRADARSLPGSPLPAHR